MSVDCLESQALHITSKLEPVKFQYNIHRQTLEANTEKHHGVALQNHLHCNKYIDATAKKASNTRAFLQRNLQQCLRKTKELCYKTLVRPILDYASIIWDPFTDNNIRKLEMVQRRAARMVFSDYRSTSRITTVLQQLQWPTLQEHRAQTKVFMIYCIVYSLVDIPLCHLTPTISVRGHNMKFQIPYARTSIYQRSFFPDTIRLWNSLPQTVVSSSTLDSFKEEVQTVKIPLDSYWMILTALYIDILAITFLLIVPAPPTRQ